MSETTTGARISLHRVLFAAAMIALCGAVAWKGWERDYLVRTAEPAVPATPPAPVTDVSGWASRQMFVHHREWMSDLFGDDTELLFDQCGRHHDESSVEPDAVRLTYLDNWGRDAFTVGITSRGEDAVATWQPFVINPPPPPPPRLGSKATGEDTPPYRLYRITSTTSRPLDAKQWRRALAAVSDPAFSRLVPSEGTGGHDGYSLTIESCVDGRYQLVHRFSPHGPEQRTFLRAWRTIERATGAMHTVPEYVSESDGNFL